MSHTEAELKHLRAEVQRLTEALSTAHSKLDGVSKDKDDAFTIIQMVVAEQPGQRYTIDRKHLERYDPKQWTLDIVKDPTDHGLHLTLRDKRS